jgi:hypothetical protein
MDPDHHHQQQQQQNGRAEHHAHEGNLTQEQPEQEQQMAVAEYQQQQQQQAVLYVAARLLGVALHFMTMDTMSAVYSSALARAYEMREGQHRETSRDGEGPQGGESSRADGGGGDREWVLRPGFVAAALAIGRVTSCLSDAAGSHQDDADQNTGCSTASDAVPQCRFGPRDLEWAVHDEMMEVEKRLLVSPLLGYATVPSDTLGWVVRACDQFIQQMPPEVRKRVQGCLEGVQPWFGPLLIVHMAAVGEWQDEMVLLRVPCMLSNALVDALPVDFACNNPHCGSLDGPWELGLVSQRAKVVCGGCGVARYCSRKCQKLHWGEHHKPVCQALNGGHRQ